MYVHGALFTYCIEKQRFMKEVSVNEVQEWAKDFLSQSEKELTKEELKEQRKYAILVQKPNDKVLLSKMLDESSQIRNNRKLALRMKILIDRYGVPEFFNPVDTFLMKMFALVGYLFPWIAMPIFKKRLRGHALLETALFPVVLTCKLIFQLGFAGGAAALCRQ